MGASRVGHWITYTLAASFAVFVFARAERNGSDVALLVLTALGCLLFGFGIKLIIDFSMAMIDSGKDRLEAQRRIPRAQAQLRRSPERDS